MGRGVLKNTASSNVLYQTRASSVASPNLFLHLQNGIEVRSKDLTLVNNSGSIWQSKCQRT